MDLVARDVEALRRDPPRVTLKLSAEGLEKIQQASRFGAPVELRQGELMGIKSSFDFLLPPEQFGQLSALRITPMFPNSGEFPRQLYIRSRACCV
jgi:hypothetical protein